MVTLTYILGWLKREKKLHSGVENKRKIAGMLPMKLLMLSIFEMPLISNFLFQFPRISYSLHSTLPNI